MFNQFISTCYQARDEADKKTTKYESKKEVKDELIKWAWFSSRMSYARI